MPPHVYKSADVCSCIITSSGFQRVINTFPCLSSYNTSLDVPWVQSKVLVAWIRIRIQHRLQLQLQLQLLAPASQMPNSECSSLEEQMPEKLRFCRGSATQQRVRSSTGLVRRVLANWYVLIPSWRFPSQSHPDPSRLNSTPQ